jgi:hypothetical protein
VGTVLASVPPYRTTKSLRVWENGEARVIIVVVVGHGEGGWEMNHLVSWKLLVASAVIAALVVPLQLSSIGNAAVAVGPCTDVQIIGVRGSGEDYVASNLFMGDLLGPIAERIIQRAPHGTTVSTYGLPYLAGDANPWNVIGSSYWRSVDDGIAKLDDYLDAVVAACPSMKLVIAGYSQGAQVAGRVLSVSGTSRTDHIAAFLMFGDPEFNPGAVYAVGDFDRRDYGIFGKRSSSEFSTWSARVHSWCNQNDKVCQGLGWGHSSDFHEQELYVQKYGAAAADWTAKRLGWPAGAGGFGVPLDIAFVIDSTGSMASAINGAITAAASISVDLANRGADFRVALVDYKDTNQGDPYAARIVQPFTSEAALFGLAVASLTASGGGDTPEAVYSGIETAIKGLSWRAGAKKAIVLMGDAAAKDPEPVTGYTHAHVLEDARNLDPAVIYGVPLSSSAQSSFAVLTEGSEGALFPASNASTVVSALTTAVTTAVEAPTATLTVSTPARPGDAVEFSSAGSWYSQAEIVEYRWDFDGDGAVDATTTEPHTTHVYAAEFHGTATVKVAAADGHSATAIETVDISPAAPVPPGPPADLTARQGADAQSLLVTWHPPADLGGGTVAGYGLTVTRDSASDAALVQLIDPGATSVTVPDLERGNYTVRLVAFTEGGTSADAVAGPVAVGAQLTVTAQDQSRLFGRANPPLTVTITGFVGGDGPGIFTGSAACTTPATAFSPAGTYPIVCAAGTLSAPGYTFAAFVPGTLTVSYTRPCLTRVQAGPLTVTAGQAICIGEGGTLAGPVTVQPGGALDVEDGRVTGPVTAVGASGIRLCGAIVTGPLSVAASTGLVLVGGDAATGRCDGNTINGPVTFTDNRGGVELNGNVVTGPVTITRTTGSLPPPDTGSVHQAANTITGRVTISP